MTSGRPLRAVAAMCALTMLGACGSSGDDPAGVAKEDRAVVQRNKEVAEFEAKIKAALREKWQKQAEVRRARARARARAAARTQRPPVTVRLPGGRVVPSSGGICAPIPRSLGKAERRARIEQRRRTLDYLNLRCPSQGVPRL